MRLVPLAHFSTELTFRKEQTKPKDFTGMAVGGGHRMGVFRCLITRY